MTLNVRALSPLTLICCLAAACSNTSAENPNTPKSRPADYGQPCSRNDDCSDKACWSISDDTQACSMTCADPEDCVPGWICAPIQDRQDNICQCHASPESCDSLDNDCNGLVDDNCMGCAVGKHDNGNGVCVTEGCADGYHDGGTGDCAPIGQCSLGYQDGGDGSCVLGGMCSNGFKNNGTGTCVTQASPCANGYHNGGANTCVAVGSCFSGYKSDGTGTCIAQSAPCAAGYHDGGGGQCIPTGDCSTGFHDGGNGTCIAVGACVSGYKNDGTGVCVAQGADCADYYRDNGIGVCISYSSPCANGFHEGGNGTCVAIGTCANYYYLKGSSCAPMGDTCSTALPVALTPPANPGPGVHGPSFVIDGDLQDGTVSTWGNGCYPNTGRTVWYSVQVPAQRSLSLVVTSSSFVAINRKDACAQSTCQGSQDGYMNTSNYGNSTATYLFGIGGNGSYGSFTATFYLY